MIILDTNIAAAKAAGKCDYRREAEKRRTIMDRLRRGIPVLGGAMATLTDNPSGEWIANEVYEIQATDKSEGASLTSSFGGIGLSNEPHQQLANRTAFLKQRQDTNIANIGALQGFVAMFVGSMSKNGYIKIPFVDISLGEIVALIQWGFQVINGGEDLYGPFSFPIAFPNACMWYAVSTLTDETKGGPIDDVVMASTSFGYPPSKTRFYAYNNNLGSGGNNQYGFNWLAIGY